MTITAKAPTHVISTDEAEQRWQRWIADACHAVGVDADLVDIADIHLLSKQVAHRLERPLVPVSAFILGLALGLDGEAADRAELLATLLDTLPAD